MAAGRTLWFQVLPAPTEPTTILPAIPVPCLLYGTEPAVSSATADAARVLPAITARLTRQAVQYSLRLPPSLWMITKLMWANQQYFAGIPPTPPPARVRASPPEVHQALVPPAHSRLPAHTTTRSSVLEREGILRHPSPRLKSSPHPPLFLQVHPEYLVVADPRPSHGMLPAWAHAPSPAPDYPVRANPVHKR